jgi:hypothetical protein
VSVTCSDAQLATGAGQTDPGEAASLRPVRPDNGRSLIGRWGLPQHRNSGDDIVSYGQVESAVTIEVTHRERNGHAFCFEVDVCLEGAITIAHQVLPTLSAATVRGCPSNQIEL